MKMCRSKGILPRILGIARRIHESFCVIFPLEKSPFVLHQDECHSYHGNDDNDERSSIDIPCDFPEDHLAIYSGNKHPHRRFVVRTSDLNHPLFRLLLDKAEEEFGFEQRGVLVIPCDPKLVQHLLSLVQTKALPESASFYGEFRQEAEILQSSSSFEPMANFHGEIADNKLR